MIPSYAGSAFATARSDVLPGRTSGAGDIEHLHTRQGQDAQGRWMLYRHDRKPEAIDWTNLPPELIGRGQVIGGVLRRPEE
ncbi:hypothetical protein [Microvirga sp. G4-2]|uniref:hypothetical protein n=1 Tax=Microvirga sp. G4-2 TaxID=3434467 RepID=UPI004044E81C